MQKLPIRQEVFPSGRLTALVMLEAARAGKGKPPYELTALLPIEEPPRGGEQEPATESKPPSDDKPHGGK